MPITFESVDEYARAFTDVTLWQPVVERICERHGLAITAIHAGVAGTHPVFLVASDHQRYVVKLYETTFFAGARSYGVEHDLYQWLPDVLPVAVPRLVAHGTLDDAGRWPYIITTTIAGASLGQVREHIPPLDMLHIAATLGNTLSQLHGIPITTSPLLTQLRAAFDQFMHQQRAQCVAKHQRWNTLPTHLIDQIPAYLAQHAHLDTLSAACLTHADLTDDHVFCAVQNGRWQVTGLIDFGDAWVGDPFYELVALYVSVFQAQKSVLHTFLTAYTPQTTFHDHFVERAMLATLLFEFNSFDDVATHQPAALEAATLAEVAQQLWGLE